MQLPVYMDYNATTPVDERVLAAMLPFFTIHFGNAASSNHEYGWYAAEAVKIAREQIAALIHAEPGEIIFTSGATEAINLAIKGVYEIYAAKGNHIITCVTEHRAVLDTCSYLEKKGARITYLPVDDGGNINLHELERSIAPDTILIALMYANNETGVIYPVSEIGAIAKKHGVLFFCDATQAAGKIPVHVQDDNIDIMCMSAHKMYGPKGAGALYVRRRNPRVTLAAQIHGGGHEKGLRSGTLNVPGIAGLGKACNLMMSELHDEMKRIRKMRDEFEHALLSRKAIFSNVLNNSRLPNVINICFRGADKNALHTALGKKVAFSAGSACTSAKPEPSHVLKAMGLSKEDAGKSVRLSIGRFTKEEDITFATNEILNIAGTLIPANDSVI